MTSRRSSRADRRTTSAWPIRSMADAGTKARRRPTRITGRSRGVGLPVSPAGDDVVQRPTSWPVWFRTGRPRRPASDTMESKTPSDARMRRVRRRRWSAGRSAFAGATGIIVSGSARSSTVAWPWSYLL